VLEPPSDELVRTLTELQLCRSSDFRRARGRVRRLASDLPAFDSVWIDSLVQLRLLTPYQAAQLESGKSEQLRIGPFVAVDCLAKSANQETLLSKRLNDRAMYVLKRIRVSSDQVDDLRKRMNSVIERTKGFVHPNVVVPHELIAQESEIVLASRYVRGISLSEMLVRRGRFPASVAVEIGCQILQGLAALQARSIVHGDIRLSNVRLTENGLAVLVDGGIRQVLRPQFTIHDDLDPDAYDGIAPELVGTGAPATASSELYAVGCMLWQLLAGRPPFLSADSLSKLAAHQTGKIADVREWAPDTPAPVAEALRRLTSADPLQRPRDFQEAIRELGRSKSFGRARLKRYHQLFADTVPHLAGPLPSKRASMWIWTTAMILAVAAGITLFYDKSMQHELLSIGNSIQRIIDSAREQKPPDNSSTDEQQSTTSTSTTSTSTTSSKLLRLPDPDADGIILLKSNGPFEAREIRRAGSLVVRAAAGSQPEIRIRKSPLVLDSTRVTLEGITLRNDSNGESKTWLMIRCQQLSVRHCQFNNMDDTRDHDDSSAMVGSAIKWIPSDVNALATTEILVENTAFQAAANSLFFKLAPHSLSVVNTLKTGEGGLIVLGEQSLKQDFKIQLDRVTLRHSGPLVFCQQLPSDKQLLSRIHVNARRCVFQLRSRDVGLVCFSADDRYEPNFEFSGDESVVDPNTTMLALFNPDRGRFEELETDEQFDGLVAGEIQFARNEPRTISDSRVIRFQGPMTSTDGSFPGIVPADFKHD
jgi:serine/threonine protein kinase